MEWQAPPTVIPNTGLSEGLSQGHQWRCCVKVANSTNSLEPAGAEKWLDSANASIAVARLESLKKQHLCSHERSVKLCEQLLPQEGLIEKIFGWA